MRPDPSTRVRFLTCGSVDDGKSTFIGRLLLDTQQVFDDQWAALQDDSRRWGTRGGGPDPSLLVDGLQAEREQGITIDVAWRFFSTPRRAFVVADTPGHEQYTRNMAVAASTAETAIVLVDARKGIVTQTRRHSRILALMGVRRALLAVNKMDLVGWSQERFEAVAGDYRTFAAGLGIEAEAVPLSALTGENVTRVAERATWYVGPVALAWLEELPPTTSRSDVPLRLPVQAVLHPDADFRGYCGTISQGRLRPGDHLVVQPSGLAVTVREVRIGFDTVPQAGTGDAVCVTLDEDGDVGRGDVLSDRAAALDTAEQFHAHVVWVDSRPLIAGRPYWLKLAHRTVGTTITSIRHLVDPDSGEHIAAHDAAANAIAAVHLSVDSPLPFAPYAENRDLGGFLLIDRMTQATAGAGMIDFALRRDRNLRWQDLSVDRAARAALKGQKPVCVWFTGLSGSGKSTLASLLDRRLYEAGRHTYVLDGDNLRHGLNRDLGFTESDRAENVRRVAEVARLMVDAGLIVLVSFISPFRAERDFARSLFAPEEFVEVFVDTPLAECERRDPKGLYAKARRGEIPNFTGIGSPYEPPVEPEVHLDAHGHPPDDLVDRILQRLDAACAAYAPPI